MGGLRFARAPSPTAVKTMKCKCVKCEKRYTADAALQEELARFYLAHHRKVPAEPSWICDDCWKSFKPELLEQASDGPH